MVHSWHRKSILANKRGFSTAVGAIFVVLAVLFLYFNVYTYTQNQDTQLQDIISQSQQLDADRNAEHLTITGDSTLSPNQVTLAATITNDSPLPVQIVRVFAEGTQNPSQSGNALVNLVLASGETKNLSLILDAQISGTPYIRFITSRGNSFTFSPP